MDDWIIDLIFEFYQSNIGAPASFLDPAIKQLAKDLREGFQMEAEYCSYGVPSAHDLMNDEIKKLKEQHKKELDYALQSTEQRIKNIESNWNYDYARLRSAYLELKKEKQ